jgi:hypothetical protein
VTETGLERGVPREVLILRTAGAPRLTENAALKPVQEMTPAEQRTAGRIVGGFTSVFLVGLYLWSTRSELERSIPAMLLAGVLGLAGVGLVRLARVLLARGRRAAPMSELEFVAGAALAIAAPAACAARFSDQWLGWHSVIGSVVFGFSFGCILLFARMAVRGLPPGAAESPPARGAADEPSDSV